MTHGDGARTAPGKVVIAGGSGFLGRALAEPLARDGCEVVVLTRDPERSPAQGIRPVAWDGRTVGPWAAELSGARALVNLAGHPIDGLWTARTRHLLRESRLAATAALVRAALAADPKPHAFLQGSAVGFYGDALGNLQDESSPGGEGFLSQLARDWEAASLPAETGGIRRCLLRTGIVLGRGGGLHGRLKPLFRLGLGGVPGDGRAHLPWIHLDDWTGAVRFLMARDDLSGPFNLAAPAPAPMGEFVTALARSLRRPALFRAPAFALRMLLADQADEFLLADRNAVPRRLLDAGYRFARPDLAGALAALAG